ncbi:MAG TPA: hypothetical protein VG146_18045 [Verrucomicrobiae bacterium]|nr:hypothetical protein [Verrucomicrobiae bacterium]
MNIYRNLQQNLKPVETDLAQWGKTLGGAVMAKAKQQNWKSPGHLPEITHEFYEQLMAFNWKWTPSRSCGDLKKAAAILDGDMYHAECQAAANAFKLLLETKAPYGFGLADVKLKVYVGEKAMTGAEANGPTGEHARRAPNSNGGFYSMHPLAGVHGLKPNVFDVQTNKLAPVYAWTDHKVVEYGGRFYDVCYDAIYGQAVDMAIALTLGCNEDSRPTKTIQEAMSRIQEFKVLIKNWFQIAYFRSAAPDSTAGQLDAKEIGPFAESLFGDEKTELHPYGSLVPMSKWPVNQ